MPSPRVIDNRTARRLFLQRQGLGFPPHRKLSDEGLLQLIEHLGFVQIDSIQTVERAHHMILFARNQTYRKTQLARLHERDGLLFENWTHDAAIIPSRFFPYWRSEEHTSELQSLMRISYAVFCLKKKKTTSQIHHANTLTYVVAIP